jgi:hypothetical protein
MLIIADILLLPTMCVAQVLTKPGKSTLLPLACGALKKTFRRKAALSAAASRQADPLVLQ